MIKARWQSAVAAGVCCLIGFVSGFWWSEPRSVADRLALNDLEMQFTALREEHQNCLGTGKIARELDVLILDIVTQLRPHGLLVEFYLENTNGRFRLRSRLLERQIEGQPPAEVPTIRVAKSSIHKP